MAVGAGGLGNRAAVDKTVMGRLRSLLVGSVFARAGAAAVLALALAGLVASTSGRAGEPGRERQQPREPAQHVEVIDLNEVSAAPKPKPRRAHRPAEDLSQAELAAVERQIRSRSSDAVAPDDGVSPGAPSDEQVREELRGLRRAQSSASAGPIKRGSGGLVQPANGHFTSPFGQRWGRLHAGIDVAAPTGTPIRAAAAGQVILMAPTGGYGKYTCIDHGSSVSTCYAHQSRFATSRGAWVKQGEVIGYVGNTGHSFGAHLHFEVRINGRPVDPMDYL
jgi:murein DD-endopeptidase MepM/ murein hydrolase activator NlpD